MNAVGLRLDKSGWREVLDNGGDNPVSVPEAYELARQFSDNPQYVLDKTREFCGNLRIRAMQCRDPRKRRALESLLKTTRSGLDEARKLKCG